MWGTGTGPFSLSDSALFNATSLFPSLPDTLVNMNTARLKSGSVTWDSGQGENKPAVPQLCPATAPAPPPPGSHLPLPPPQSQSSAARIFLFGPCMNLPPACSHKDTRQVESRSVNSELETPLNARKLCGLGLIMSCSVPFPHGCQANSLRGLWGSAMSR